MSDNQSKDQSRKIETDLTNEQEKTSLTDHANKHEEIVSNKETKPEDSLDQVEVDESDLLDNELQDQVELAENELLEEVEQLNELDNEDLSTDELVDEAAIVKEQPRDAEDSEAAALPAKEEQQEGSRESRRKKRSKKERLRLIPIWLRILIAIVLIGGSLILGLIVGFSVIGGGGDPKEVINPDTWYHIMDIVRGRH